MVHIKLYYYSDLELCPLACKRNLPHLHNPFGLEI